MSTRSIIAKENADGTFTGIYCHWDGYPNHNGVILVREYSDERKINKLMKLGDLSILGPEIGEKHDFNNRDNRRWCTAYGRDRGEKGTRAVKYATQDAIFEHHRWQEYVYIWRRNSGGISGGQWDCYTAEGKPVSLDNIKKLV